MGVFYFFPSWHILIFLSEHLLLIIIKSRNFPGGLVVKNPHSSAGDMGLIPDLGTGIPHAAEKLSPRTTTTELSCSGACSPQLEKPTHHHKEHTCHN